jgi:HK97 family phage major capsid protein
MLWGLPVVESDGMSRGDFLVGAFRLAATLFDREEAAILVSTEDQDNFVKNLVTILAEERLALAITRPTAFVHGGFPAGSTT